MIPFQSKLLCSVGIILFPLFGTAAGTGIDALTMHHSGFLGLEVGQIVHGYNDSKAGGVGEINRGWCERMLFQYANNVEVTDRIRFNLAIECQMSFSFPYWLYASWEAKLPKFSFYPDRAEGTYTIGDPDLFRYEFGFGYFPYRINPDVKNLGEYLFRTGTYPLYVLNNFNRPYSRLLGLRSSFTFARNANMDVLLTSATTVPPLANFSLSCIGRYNLFDIIDAGAGVSFANLFPIDESLTTPTGNDATRYTDVNGDTAYYTFKGVKPTATISFDPKPLVAKLTAADLFNEQDLRIYGEVCVSGWKNYRNYDTSLAGRARNYYEKRADRTVFMVGMNAPSIFKPLGRLCDALGFPLPFLDHLDFDVVSFEYEYVPNKYPNSTFNMLGVTTQPVPAPSLFPSTGSDGKVHPRYWTIYVKKTFLQRFAIIAQFARDHMRPINNDPAYQYVEDVLERKGDWWWNIRLNVGY
ncbi:MAG: hypothetical protein JXA18_00935 [Chitinispirillaceae bacterium]|nr:hypothetical protein [Chitinispirillaceae bacterium]